MKKIFVDTNVLIDFLADRKPFSLISAQIFTYAVAGKVKLYISAVSYNNTYYILRQSHTHASTIKLLKELSEITEVADVTELVIKNSLRSTFNDFEDAIQYNSALSIPKIDFIITRDSKDFKRSEIPVLTPTEGLALLAIENT